MSDSQQHLDLRARQPTRVLPPEQLSEVSIDTMANWALDGLYPTRETVESIKGGGGTAPTS